jgi:GNAT superfamily N-acetyltransferase
MAGRLSPREREYATLVAQLGAFGEDLDAARATVRRAAGPPHLDLHHDDTAPPPRGERIRLADGAEIVIRPIEPGDRHDLAVGFEHLSALSRFRSLRASAGHLTARQLEEATNVDHVSHEALVAFDDATGEGIAVARYVRDADDPTGAEVACTVADAWQRRGVGSALVERLAARARAAGIARFAARIVVGDEPARRLLGHVADEIGEHRDGGTVEIVAQPRD